MCAYKRSKKSKKEKETEDIQDILSPYKHFKKEVHTVCDEMLREVGIEDAQDNVDYLIKKEKRVRYFCWGAGLISVLFGGYVGATSGLATMWVALPAVLGSGYGVGLCERNLRALRTYKTEVLENPDVLSERLEAYSELA